MAKYTTCSREIAQESRFCFHYGAAIESVVGALRPVVALGLVALSVAGVFLTACMNDNIRPIIAQGPLDKPPAALLVRAKEVIQQPAYESEAVDSEFRHDYNTSYARHIVQTDDSVELSAHFAVWYASQSTRSDPNGDELAAGTYQEDAGDLFRGGQ